MMRWYLLSHSSVKILWHWENKNVKTDRITEKIHRLDQVNYFRNEIGPTWKVQVPSSRSFTNVVTSMWESVIYDLVWTLCVLPADVSATTTMCYPFPSHHVYLKKHPSTLLRIHQEISLWSAKAKNFGKFKEKNKNFCPQSPPLYAKMCLVRKTTLLWCVPSHKWRTYSL